MITINQVWRYLRGRALTAQALSELLQRPVVDVEETLTTLQQARVVRRKGDTWSLADNDARPTDIRDELVLKTVKTVKVTSREDLTPQIPGSTPAQVYTSLRRLCLTGRAKKTTNGSRTPVYELA